MKFSQHLATNILLAGVLLVLVLIWHRMPPKGTIDVEVMNSSLDVKVENSSLDVNVENPTLDVNVENPTLHVKVENPYLDVEVGNTLPIPVTIEK